ncbi:MAG: SDR family oxidoreductase [Akkermansiaceae bacterium]|nr:SDR family oxidoreductase [Armatimonadota bacterium]
MKLDQQHLVVVGGSTGIGFATARLALAEGASGVTLIGRSADKLATAKERLADDRVSTGVADVSDAAALSAAFAPLTSIDHVYVSAGTLSAGPIAVTEPAVYAQGVNERIWGNLNVVRVAVPKLKPSGSITFTSGMLSQRPSAGTAITTMLASGVEGLVRALPFEIAPIRVNAVVPGMVDTPLIRSLVGDNTDAALAAEGKRVPIGRAGTAEEVADAVLFLITNKYINGESLYLHGGGRYA